MKKVRFLLLVILHYKDNEESKPRQQQQYSDTCMESLENVPTGPERFHKRARGLDASAQPTQGSIVSWF